MRVAQFLAAHPKVERVHYPGLPSHPQHDLARKQMSSFGGMLSFELKGDRAAAMALPNRTQIFTRATSLGGVESLIEHRQSIEGPDTLTPETLLRLSIGLEHPDDLIADLDAGANRRSGRTTRLLLLLVLVIVLVIESPRRTDRAGSRLRCTSRRIRRHYL